MTGRRKARPPAVGTVEAQQKAGCDDIFRRIFESVEVGIYQSTREGRLIRANSALARLYAFGSAEQMIGEVTDAGRQLYVDPAARAEFVRRLEIDGQVAMIYEIARRDGGRLWVSSRARVAAGADGGHSYIGTMVDITELIRVQYALHEAETSYRAIFEHAPVGIYRSAPDGRQLRANPALVRLNGYESEQELLDAVEDIALEWYVDPARRDEFRRRIEVDGVITNFHSEIYRHKTRERIWVSENARAVRDATGHTLFYEGTVQDITERKRAEEALRLSEERFRDYAETASDWFWETDIHHRMTVLSDRIRAFGFDPEKRLGRSRADLVVGDDVEAEALRDHVATLDRHEPFRNFTYRTKAEDGSTRYISVSGNPVFDGDRRFVGYRGSARDVTSEVFAARRLDSAKQAAEAASAAKSAFLANMSHELRTPLNAILGFSELMARELFGGLDPRYREYARHIGDSGRHLLALINDILDMSKIGAGQMDLQESALDLAELVREELALLEPTAQLGDVRLVADLPVEPLELIGDHLRLRQVVLNLISNAIKFTPPDGEVRARAALAADGRPFIEVRDTGIGMTAEEAQVAMEPFRQIDSGISRRYPGTGLGLPISLSLVRLHGGDLTIASEKGHGTTVTVLLPASRLVVPRVQIAV